MKRGKFLKSIKQLQEEAEEILKEQDNFLLVYDVINSKDYQDSQDLLKKLWAFNQDVNKQFQNHLSKGRVSTMRTFAQFNNILGDMGGGFLKSTEPITKIIKRAEKTLPFDLRWAVGRDGWDKRIKEI